MSRKLVLVLIPTFSQTIEQRICIGINEVFANQDVSVIYIPLGYVHPSNSDLDSVLRFHRQLRTLNPSAILAGGGGLTYLSGYEVLRQIFDVYRDIPIVNMGNVLEGYPSVDVDNYEAMTELMATVVGRRPNGKYLFIRGPQGNVDSELRLQALNDALAKYGRCIEPDDILVGDFTASVAQSSFKQYMQNTETVADVVVCVNDLSAKGVFDHLRSTKMKCPDDLWVTGFDDFEYAASIDPGLTTVHYPARDLGAESAKLALDLIAGDYSQTQRRVSGYPIYRGSTGDSHPGFGDYEKQLREQWAMLQERDNNARKLVVIRGVNRQQSLQDILHNLKHSLADLNVQQLSLFIRGVQEDGNSTYKEYDLDSTVQQRRSDELLLPDGFSELPGDDYWLLVSMDVEEENFGYLMAKCSPIAAEFVEFIAPQFSELLHSEALEQRNENYRVQTELNERMASLGSLVSGVAHEVNTPIGTGKLASSSLLESLQKIRHKMESKSLTKTDFDIFIEESDELALIIYQSLDRAAELISNFKMVSVDQTAESKRQFDLGEYIQSVLISLRHQLKGTPVELVTDLQEGININTYPGAVAQVVTNLFMNAMKHGFKNGTEAGTITFSLQKKDHGFVLDVSDDGQGASKEVLNHIFDPFFTTRRGKGGSGLGMHIVYNLLTQKLNWSVQLESEPGQGLRAIIKN